MANQRYRDRNSEKVVAYTANLPGTKARSGRPIYSPVSNNACWQENNDFVLSSLVWRRKVKGLTQLRGHKKNIRQAFVSVNFHRYVIYSRVNFNPKVQPGVTCTPPPPSHHLAYPCVAACLFVDAM